MAGQDAAGPPRVTFRTELTPAGRTATGLVVPPEAVEALGSGKRPRVRVTLRGHTYRSTVAVMGGRFMLPVSAEQRGLAGVAAGDELDVALELDTAPREVTVPPDLRDALDADPEAARAFASLSFSHQRAHVDSITSAKTTQTRERRVSACLDRLLGRQARS